MKISSTVLTENTLLLLYENLSISPVQEIIIVKIIRHM
jgi:hypothetical protein